MQDRKNCAAADAQQRAHAKNQVVYRQADIQRRKAELANAVGDKVGIRQNVKGEADHADHARCHISKENAGDILF